MASIPKHGGNNRSKHHDEDCGKSRKQKLQQITPGARNIPKAEEYCEND
jgi:hypothetical protein